MRIWIHAQLNLSLKICHYLIIKYMAIHYFKTIMGFQPKICFFFRMDNECIIVFKFLKFRCVHYSKLLNMIWYI